MDISRTRVVLRERAVVDVLDLAVRFLAQHWGVYARLGAIVLLPLLGASWLIARSSEPLWGWGFSVFTMSLASAPFTLLASRLVFEDDVRLSTILASALRGAPKLLLLRALALVLGALGLAFLVVPGLWVFSVTFFVVEVLLLERATLGMTLRRSSRLVFRDAGQGVVAAMLLALAHALAVMAVDVGGRMTITGLFESKAPMGLFDDGWSPLALAGFWLFVPYAATARFFVYLDVRTRSEGWDIQTRFAAIASRPVGDTRTAA